MTDPAPAEDLTEFRFQIFYEDTIRPLIERREPRIGIPLDIFEFGELREATAVAALAVACGVLPREPFRAMLESHDIQSMLSGDLDQTDMGVTSLPPPITELPDWGNVLEWSEIDMGSRLIPLMSALTATYASLMRQVHRNEFQRDFNAELLFSSEDSWQVKLRQLASSARNRFPAYGRLDDTIWVAEGLDSYLDLAEDLGAATHGDETGRVSHFYVGDAGPMGTDDVKQMIELGELLPLMAWRFGGAALADTVSQRVRSVEDVIIRLVAEVDIQQLGTGRYELREQ